MLLCVSMYLARAFNKLETSKRLVTHLDLSALPPPHANSVVVHLHAMAKRAQISRTSSFPHPAQTRDHGEEQRM